MKTIIAMSLLLLGAAAVGADPAAAATPCNPVGKLNFICGPLNAEDLVQVPGTQWIVASGMAGGKAGQEGALQLVNAKDKSAKELFPGLTPRLRPNKAAYGKKCPLPDMNKFSAHGLSLHAGAKGADTLYVVNHGGRESVEIFSLDTKGAEPAVTWVGCAVMPAHTWPNGVAALPDGGFLVTDMFDPQDKKAADKMNAGKNTGAVYEWHPKKGFTKVPDSEASGDNGIVVSPDGKWIYVSAWGNKAVMRLSRGAEPAQRKMLKVGYLADNLRQAPDGTLLIGGQNVSAKQVFSCFESHKARCTGAWRIDRWDTKAMTVKPLFSEAGNPEFGGGTVGLQIGDELFVGTFRGDRIAYLSLK